MAYSIQYDPEYNSRFPIKPFNKVWTKLASYLLIVSVLILCLFGYARETVKSWLLPGDPTVTEDALISMVEDIRAGEPIGDAITAFCLEILENAQGSK